MQSFILLLCQNRLLGQRMIKILVYGVFCHRAGTGCRGEVVNKKSPRVGSLLFLRIINFC